MEEDEAQAYFYELVNGLKDSRQGKYLSPFLSTHKVIYVLDVPYYKKYTAWGYSKAPR